MTNKLPPGFLGDLRRGIVECFNMDELKILCLDLDINFENIPGETIEIKALELIKYSKRLGKQLANLLEYCKSKRDWYSWPDMVPPPTGNILIPPSKPKDQPIVTPNQGIAWSLLDYWSTIY
jgi:Effector-associated domain 7